MTAQVNGAWRIIGCFIYMTSALNWSITPVECMAKKELRIAWFAPKEMLMGASASTTVNPLKIALRVIETTYLWNSSVS